MSYIDGNKHEIVGLFGGLPVYHPLVDIAGTDDSDEFSCSVKQIVIGGGGGEHPGLVVRQPISAVIRFLTQHYEEEHKLENVEWWESLTDQYLFRDDIFDFAGWGVDTYHQFYELCKSPAMYCPFNDDISRDESMGFEEWLSCSIGEFIFYAMPELVEPIMQHLEKPYEGIDHIYYNNILLIPPNMPVYANSGNAWKMERRNKV